MENEEANWIPQAGALKIGNQAKKETGSEKSANELRK
jgi:hypothetical protein